MGFMDFLSPALTAASQGVGGWMAGLQQRREREQNDALKMIQMSRQNRLDQEASQMHQAQIENMNAEKALRDQRARADETAFKIGQTEFADDPTFQGLFQPGGGYADYLKTKRKEKVDRASDQEKQFEAWRVGHEVFKGQGVFGGDAPRPGFDYDKALSIATQQASQDATQKRFEISQTGINNRFLTGLADLNRRFNIGQAGIDRRFDLGQNKPPVNIQEVMTDVQPMLDMLTQLEGSTGQFLAQPLPRKIQALTPGVASKDQDIMLANMEAQKRLVIEAFGKIGGLGVLQPSDIKFLEGLVGDATNVRNMIRSPQYTATRFKAVRDYIDSKVGSIQQQYPQRYGPGGSTPVTLKTTPTTTTTPTTKKISAEDRQALRDAGFTEERINKQYGPP